MENENELIAAPQTNALQFCSMQANTTEEKAALFNAVNNPDEVLAAHIGDTILITDVFVGTYDKVNKETGEVTTGRRIILLDDTGKTYFTGSSGIYLALQKLTAIFGQPHWEEPIPIKIRQVNSKGHNILTFDVCYE